YMYLGHNICISVIYKVAIHPVSAIILGKKNPVIEKYITMVCAQVIGNDSAITVAAQSGNFELNVMLPVVAHILLQSITIMGNAVRNLAERSVARLSANKERIAEMIGRNPGLGKALHTIIGY